MQPADDQTPKSRPETAEPPPIQATTLDQRSNQIAFGGAVTTPAREITGHRRKRGLDSEPNDLDDALKVEALDGPGAGGANHRYRITLALTEAKGFLAPVEINFQNGAIQDVGVNGISNEALLAIVRDRLQGFQLGEFSNSDNENAIDGVDAALRALHKRTKDRIARKVEGTSKQ